MRVEYRLCYSVSIDVATFEITVKQCDGEAVDIAALMRDARRLVRYIHSALQSLDPSTLTLKHVQMLRELRDEADRAVRHASSLIAQSEAKQLLRA